MWEIRDEASDVVFLTNQWHEKDGGKGGCYKEETWKIAVKCNLWLLLGSWIVSLLIVKKKTPLRQLGKSKYGFSIRLY